MSGPDSNLLIAWGTTVLAIVGAILWVRRNRDDEEEEELDVGGVSGGGNFPLGKLDVYFGSQTGTAEGFATVLVDEGKRKGFDARIVDLNEFSAEEFEENGRAIFVMATYGEGDPCDNAVNFCNWLKDSAGKLTYPSVMYTVFACGNRQYEHFCGCGKKTNAGLEALQCERMFEYGEGDDGGTIEDDFDDWKERMWKAVVPKCGGVEDEIAERPAIPKKVVLPFEVQYVSAAEAKGPKTPISDAASSTKFYWQWKYATVTANRELRSPGADGSTVHVEFDITGTGMSYQAADNLAVLAVNPPDQVEKLARSQGYDLDATIVIEPTYLGQKQLFPTPCTVRDVLTYYKDICAVPRKGVVEMMAMFAQDEAERKKLMFLTSKEGRDEYQSFVANASRTTTELLTECFKSVKVPLDYLIHMVPHLYPRDYTISSSSSVYPNSIHLTVAVLQRKYSDGRVYTGVCSSYIARLKVGEKVRVFVRASTFRLPADDKPIVMLGPGTGIAPMRALIQERAYRKAKGANIFYFGCRKKDSDYLYRSELEKQEADGTITTLRLAFSRDGPKKVYVQNLLLDNAAEAWKLVGIDGGSVYVCGGTAMGSDIVNAFRKVCQDHGGMSADEAKDFIEKLQKDGRYVQELWS